MSTLSQILGSPEPFLDRLFQELDHLGLASATRLLYLDHICYRVDSQQRYESLRTTLEEHHSLLTETEIGGRPIASFLLNQPINYQNRFINCLELPAPKPGRPYADGYEHVEFVIQESFQSFMDRNPQISFKTKGITKPINPEISIQFNGMAVKFHHHPLPFVVKYLDE